MSVDKQENCDRIPATERDSVAERFRTHLRMRLSEMRENARRIGASSNYIESLDRSSTMVLTAVTPAKSPDGADVNPSASESPAASAKP